MASWHGANLLPGSAKRKEGPADELGRAGRAGPAGTGKHAPPAAGAYGVLPQVVNPLARQPGGPTRIWVIEFYQKVGK